ncbi:MAG: hypothetical protein GEV06_16690 [Luteitalea sp.]|nr:hypothetical protein [Luteitalea sp.]
MTPLQIQMMLHYFAIAAPYAERDPAHAFSPAVVGQRGDLIRSGLLRVDDSPSGYEVTARGRAYVEALKRVPLPGQQWVAVWPKD